MSYELNDSYFVTRKPTSICAATSTDFDSSVEVAEVQRDRRIECPVCSKPFSSTSTLNRHWRDFHSDRSKLDQGLSAGAVLTSYDNDSTKILRYDVHGLSVCDSVNDSTAGQAQPSAALCNRQCSVCMKVFSSTSTLNRHRRDFHGDRSREIKGRYSTTAGHDRTSGCRSATCNGSSSSADGQSCGFCERQCPVCLKIFSSSSTLNRHRREIHGDHSDKNGLNLRCSECHRSLGNRTAFIKHLAVSHPQIAVQTEELMFSSEVAFDAWKTKMEMDTDAKFVKNDDGATAVKKSKMKDKDGIVVNFYKCQRSGGAVDYNKRRIVVGGLRPLKTSSKVGFFCPAHIIARTCSNRWVSATFVSTHFGHQHQPTPRGSSLPVRPKSAVASVDASTVVVSNFSDDDDDDSERQPHDQFRERKERLFDVLTGLFPVIDECTTENEFDAFDGLLKLVRPVLTTVRTTSSTSEETTPASSSGPPFSKQVLETLCPLIGLPVDMKSGKGQLPDADKITFLE